MDKHVIDLRSDTVTRPTLAMRQAMAAAEVGDDVFGDDPTVNRLQATAAQMLGKEAALFVPSGTMGNLIAIRTHTEPGDEIIAERSAHLYIYEAAGYAAVCGASIALVQGERGLMDAAGVAAAIRPGSSLSHFPRTRMVAIENTSNRGGGSVYDLERLTQIVDVARGAGLRLHLDGARVWNAAVALAALRPAGERDDPFAVVSEIAAPFDTISFCLSKGLGCPAGSLLIGGRDTIARAHRFRKMFGGGMRQAGILAAAGLHALDHHVRRLADDHRHAREFAATLANHHAFKIDLPGVETNMVYVDVSRSGRDGAAFAAALKEAGVLVVPTAPMTLRVVFHLDISPVHAREAAAIFVRVAGAKV